MKTSPNSEGIKNWARDDQPREKMLLKGPSALSDTELLGILIHHGYRKTSALELARQLMDRAERNWNSLARMTPEELMKIKGIGEAKAITIAAALEIGRRRQGGHLLQRPSIRNSRDAASLLQPLLADQEKEIFCALFLNRANRVLRTEILSHGGINGTLVDPRLLFKKALELDASGLVICHNHPSGSLKPSESDLDLTKKITAGAKILDLNLMDHLIVSQEGYLSFADEGLL